MKGRTREGFDSDGKGRKRGILVSKKPKTRCRFKDDD